MHSQRPSRNRRASRNRRSRRRTIRRSSLPNKMNPIFSHQLRPFLSHQMSSHRQSHPQNKTKNHCPLKKRRLSPSIICTIPHTFLREIHFQWEYYLPLRRRYHKSPSNNSRRNGIKSGAKSDIKRRDFPRSKKEGLGGRHIITGGFLSF